MLAGAWAGALLCVAALAAPAAFAVLPAADAGRVVAHVFAREAPASVAVAVVLYFIVRRSARRRAVAGRGSVAGADVLLVLGTLFCTVAGYYALQPLMAQARAGQGAWSFATLHGVSLGLYALKCALVLTLAWRLVPRR